MYELFDAQREALLELRNRGEISDEVRRNVERDLDLEEIAARRTRAERPASRLR